MSGQPSGSGNGTAGGLVRSFSRDPSVRSRDLSPGIWRPIGGAAAPDRRMLLIFLALIVADAPVRAANPLI